MITFTRIMVNPQSRGGRRLLTNPQAMHAAVRASFPPDLDETAARVLWRLDRSDHEHTLYIVGPEEPDRRVIVDQAGWPSRPGDSANYETLLGRVVAGQERAFRLTANPVRSLPAEGAKRGRVVPHVTPEQQVAWLVEQSGRCGFELLEATIDGHSEPVPDVRVTRRVDQSFGRRDGESERRRTVTIRTAQFDGTLRVTDAERFRHTLTHGIGRARAYGCGLLTLARIAR